MAGPVVIESNLGLEVLQQKGRELFYPGGVIQRFIDSTVLNQVEPYVPFRTGATTKSGIINTRIGYGQIKWRTPYVGNIWEGRKKLANGKYSKEFNFDQSRHKKAQKKWAEAYKHDNLTKLGMMVKRKVAEQF